MRINAMLGLATLVAASRFGFFSCHSKANHETGDEANSPLPRSETKKDMLTRFWQTLRGQRNERTSAQNSGLPETSPSPTTVNAPPTTEVTVNAPPPTARSSYVPPPPDSYYYGNVFDNCYRDFMENLAGGGDGMSTSSANGGRPTPIKNRWC